jgi:hypothetical protein
MNGERSRRAALQSMCRSNFCQDLARADAVDSICYMTVDETTAQIRRDARSADELHEESRRLLVGSVRAGAAAGLSQRQISDAIGRSQPEVSRLLRFHGQSELGRTLERNRTAILKVLSAGGARNVRVFGSVSRGDDKPGSDIDLLADFTKPALDHLAVLHGHRARGDLDDQTIADSR